jgi:hypothetical protein
MGGKMTIIVFERKGQPAGKQQRGERGRCRTVEPSDATDTSASLTITTKRRGEGGRGGGGEEGRGTSVALVSLSDLCPDKCLAIDGMREASDKSAAGICH